VLPKAAEFAVHCPRLWSAFTGRKAGGLMEDSMFDEQFVTTAEEIKEPWGAG
jgi:hypothetical protein